MAMEVKSAKADAAKHCENLSKIINSLVERSRMGMIENKHIQTVRDQALPHLKALDEYFGEASRLEHYFRLLDLPPEIWTHICTLAVQYTGEVQLYDPNEEGPDDEPGDGNVQPPITRTCRLLRGTVLPISYNINEFHVYDASGRWMSRPRCTHKWLNAVRKNGRKGFQTFYASRSMHDLEDQFKLYLRGLPCLEGEAVEVEEVADLPWTDKLRIRFIKQGADGQDA